MNDDPFPDETFSPEDPYAPRRKLGCGVAGVVLGIVAGGGLLAVACCGGLAVFGMNVVAEQVAEDLRDHPVVEDQLGGITSISTSWAATAAAGEDVFVYDVKGPKGAGRLRVMSVTGGDGEEEVVSGTLETADGTRHELFPEESISTGGDAVELPAINPSEEDATGRD